MKAVDRGAQPRVPGLVVRMNFALGPALALALVALGGAAGCGSKDKKASTTPGGGGEGGSSLNDREPVEGGTAGPEGPPGSSGGDGSATGDGAGGTAGDGSGGDGGGSTAAGPEIRAPNLDPDPGEAHTAVEQHLRAARDALRGSRPDPDATLREAQAALAVDANNIEAQVLIAHAYYAKKIYDNAEVILDILYKNREPAKTNAQVFYVYGLIYDKTNRPEQAFVAYKKAVELDASYKSALVNVGTHYLRNKQYDNAVEVYERLTGQLGVNDAVTWNNLGSAYRGKSGDYNPGDAPRGDFIRKAEQAYKRAVSLDKSYAPVYYNLGLLYLDAEPFPTGGGDMDVLQRLNRAKTYFDEYRTMPGANADLVDEQTKTVAKLIKREEKKRKKKPSDSGAGGQP